MTGHTRIGKPWRLGWIGLLGLAILGGPAQAGDISEIVAFGDSLSDTGNTYKAVGYTPSPPYYQGHYSNGPIWLEDLADRLGAALNRAVVDRTGLVKEYDFTLTWSVESAGGMIPRTGPPPDEIESHGASVLTDPGLSVFSAVREQLGLALRPGKATVEMLVVTHAERVPVGN